MKAVDYWQRTNKKRERKKQTHTQRKMANSEKSTVVLKPHGAPREDKKTGIEQFDVDGRYLRVCGDSL